MMQTQSIAPSAKLPQWAPRVPRTKIWQLYQNDAKGNRDEELVDDVGMTLLLRVQSCIEVHDVQCGRGVRCPECGHFIAGEPPRRLRRGEVLRYHCPQCDWSVTQDEYRKTYHNKHLGAGGMRSACEEYAREYPRAKAYQEKIMLIDQLIHRFHWEMENSPVAPGAHILIGGKQSEVADFLNRLTYGDQNTSEVLQNRDRWREIAKGRPYGLADG